MAREFRTVRRPASMDTPEFDLAYVRAHRGAGVPVVIIPGGPGLGSVRVYGGLRRSAPDLDIVMVEHRGVGYSRRDLTGAELPASAMTVAAAVDDIAAVLDAEHIDRAVIVGSSYGTYLAQGFGVRHPERVVAMVLDSTLLSAQDHDAVRAHARRLLWEGERGPTAAAARRIRRLVEKEGADPLPLGATSAFLYEFGGVPRLERYLEQRARHRTGLVDRTFRVARTHGTARSVPYVMEFGLVGNLATRELQYAPAPDGLIFDPAYATAGLLARFPAFEKEPFDLPAALPRFDWPVVVLTGERDLTTPPSVAKRTAALARRSRFVRVPGIGHSVLDSHPEALLAAIRALLRGEPISLGGLRRRGLTRHLAPAIGGLLAVDRLSAALLRDAPSGRDGVDGRDGADGPDGPGIEGRDPMDEEQPSAPRP
ncbi:alpha/beta hydrolase [Raineyella sp.]|uniref:alpha/beta hydrolase n=1 Tax=Raineyella sp. TaxID=1911550 RepID=UPI002B206280|nr:alpha/beta hydrolase [Raineyella sp.]MEA5154986.1 alpha/beta hydrolase [Raineyella sp.]